jgi:NADH-quinone oxidoreductase subunit F
MLESIEGYRGQPRLKNILPVFSGLFQKPTLINNVETIASLPGIIENGNKWFRSMGTKLSPGHGLYSVSGHVKKPGQYEYGLGVSFRELLERCGGIRDGRKLKFWSPGGASTSIFTEEHMDVELSYEGVASSGSMLGTRSIQVFDDTVCVVWAIARWMEFYKHESCGKCTPCREGTFWMKLLYDRLEDGRGTMDDIERLSTICNNVAARGFCAFIDGAILPVLSSLKYFYDEYQAHVLNKGCNYNLTSSLALKDEDLRIPST